MKARFGFLLATMFAGAFLALSSRDAMSGLWGLAAVELFLGAVLTFVAAARVVGEAQW